MARVPVEGRACRVALVRVVIRKEQDTCSGVTGPGTARRGLTAERSFPCCSPRGGVAAVGTWL